MTDPQLSAAVETLPELDALERDWQALEGAAQASFFTSWTWIGTWLRWLPRDLPVRLLRARCGPRTVGLALIVDGPTRSCMGLPMCGTQHLHATGRPVLDALMVEHNGFLVDRELGPRGVACLLKTWMERHRGSSELVLPGLPAGHIDAALVASLAPRVTWVERIRESFAMDLAKIRASGGDPLSGLSANSRSQIRRSMKEYQTLGALQVRVASDVDQARGWMDEMIALHQAHWTSKGLPGAFSTPEFIAFHRALVGAGVPTGEVQLMRITAGDHTLAVLYSFLRAGRVYFYQGGLDYGLIEKHARPGLVAHVMAARHHAEQGLDVYDFMVGDSRYKTTLSDLRESMVWGVVQTPSVRLALERAARRWRRRSADEPVAAEALAD